MASSHSSGKKNATAAGVAIAILIALYSLVRPSINDATGWSLPAIAQSQAAPETAQAAPETAQAAPETAQAAPETAQAAPETAQAAPETASLEHPRDRNATDPAGSPRGRHPTEQPPTTFDSATHDSTSVRVPPIDSRPDDTTLPSAPTADAALQYGFLREVGPDRYLSPAGLLYTPGSAEGHRLEHLRRHTQDQPGRPGKHGVFEGGMEGALKAIDQAYENAKINKRTTQRSDGGRTIYTVDLGHRVGYVGGREGNQKHKPMARRVRLVLEGNRVITAFPL